MWWRCYTALLVAPSYGWRTEARGHTAGVQPQQSAQGLTPSPSEVSPAFCILLMLVNLLKHLDRKGLNAVCRRNWTRLGQWGLAEEGLLLQVEVDVMLQKLVTGKKEVTFWAGRWCQSTETEKWTNQNKLFKTFRKAGSHRDLCLLTGKVGLWTKDSETDPDLCECKVFWKPRCSQWATV